MKTPRITPEEARLIESGLRTAQSQVNRKTDYTNEARQRIVQSPEKKLPTAGQMSSNCHTRTGVLNHG